MPFWKSYVCTGVEVDDNDLPLEKHRIFDDDGNLKAVPTAVSSIGSSGSSNKKAKKSASPTVKAAAVHITPSRRTKSPSPKAVTPPQDNRGAHRSSAKRSAAVGGTQTSASRAPSASAQRSVSRTSKTRRSTTPTAKSAATTRRASTPRKSASTPKKKNTAAKKSPSASGKRVSASPSAKKAPSSRSPTWTVDRLKTFAKSKRIQYTGKPTKGDLIELIKAKVGRDITASPPPA